jgi:hypothetical protein
VLKYLDASAAGMDPARMAKHALATKLVIEYAVAAVQPDGIARCTG